MPSVIFPAISAEVCVSAPSSTVRLETIHWPFSPRKRKSIAPRNWWTTVCWLAMVPVTLADAAADCGVKPGRLPAIAA